VEAEAAEAASEVPEATEAANPPEKILVLFFFFVTKNYKNP